MTKLKIAHVKENNVNVIIVPLAPMFGTLSTEEKDEVISALQERAVAALLNGLVVPVWMQYDRMHFIAHPAWHRFFQKLKMSTVRANLNRELDVDDAQPIMPDASTEDGTKRDIPREPVVADMRALLAQLDPQEKWPHELPKPSGVGRILQWFGLPGS